MLTIETLKGYGANTDEGLSRCMNDEPFYLKVVGMVASDEGGHFAKLERALAAGDTPMAFAAAHALKGTTGNVSLTPIFDPARRLSDGLKGKTDAPMSDESVELARAVLAEYERLKALK